MNLLQRFLEEQDKWPTMVVNIAYTGFVSDCFVCIVPFLNLPDIERPIYGNQKGGNNNDKAKRVGNFTGEGKNYPP